MKIYIAILSSMILLGSCAASGPSFIPYIASDESSSTIYVYRPKRAVNCCVSPMVYLDGIEQSYLKNGGYLPLEVTQGQHEVTVGDGKNGFTAATVEMEFKGGGSHYLRWDIGNMNGVLVVTSVGATGGERSYRLAEIEESVAQQEISVLKLSGATQNN